MKTGCAHASLISRKISWAILAFVSSLALLTSAAFAQPAEITSPTPGTYLSSATVTFTWTPGTGVSQYWLTAWNYQGEGIYDRDQGTNLSGDVCCFWFLDDTIYVRLWSKIGSDWLWNDYVYYFAQDGVPGSLTTPTPRSTLTSPDVTFGWTPGINVSEHWLWIGTYPGGNDLYDQSQGLNTSVTVYGLPTDGRRLYVRLYSNVYGFWWLHDVWYDTAGR
jgi:hypothetical protein